MMDNNIVSGPPVSQETMDNLKLSLSQYLKNVSKKFMNTISMIDAETGERISCQEIFDKSYEMAIFLKKQGCSKDSVVAIACENRFENPSILLAVWHIGATCTCVNFLYSFDELRHAFSISRPKVVFASNVSFDKVRKVQQICTSIQTVINIDTDNYTAKNVTELELNTIKTRNEPIQPTDTATILYSSGTTGLPKGVRLSHKSHIFLMEIYRTEKFVQFPKDNVVSGLLPMSHAYGLFVMMSCLTLGHTYVLIKRYSEKTFLNYVQKYRINTLYIVPTIISFLSKDPLVLDYDLSYVKLISNGGASIKNETLEQLKKRLSFELFQHYGMTESTATCLVSKPNSKLKSTGRLVPGMMAKVVDMKTGATIGHNQPGELCVKGPLIMSGYCQNDSNYNLGVDEDGWLHSGDVAYYDDDFNFYIVERIKELIKYKSFQVPPAEIEMHLMEHEAVKEVGVVGVPDEEAGELPRAYVVKGQGFENVTETELQQYVAKKLSPPKRLRGGVIFMDELPKTVTGKISRKELKNLIKKDII